MWTSRVINYDEVIRVLGMGVLGGTEKNLPSLDLQWKIRHMNGSSLYLNFIQMSEKSFKYIEMY